jgi:hypothetical protein
MKNVNWSSWKDRVFLVRLQWNLKFLEQIFEAHSNTKFNEYPPVAQPRCPQRKEMTEANSRFSQYYEKVL